MQRHFYATASDLEPIFARLETKYSLAYTRMGSFDSPLMSPFYSGRILPTLGQRLTHTSGGPDYLVTAAETPVNVETLVIKSGAVRYLVDQLLNPDSIAFQHGGLYDENTFLYGRVGTASRSKPSINLYRSFSSAITKHFVYIPAAYVGPEALSMMKHGCRLTIGAHSPREYDLGAGPNNSFKPKPLRGSA